jgi:hypothetical protein
MPRKVGGSDNRGTKTPPLLKSQIEDAQRNTNSNRQAAIFLNVGYKPPPFLIKIKTTSINAKDGYKRIDENFEQVR